MSWTQAVSMLLDHLVSPDWRNLAVDDVSAVGWLDQRLAETTPRLGGAGSSRLTVELNLVTGPLMQLPLQVRLASVQRHIAQELGLHIPLPVVRPCLDLPPDHYQIRLGSRIVSPGGLLRPGRWLAIGPEEKVDRLPGTLLRDLTYGLPAKWVSDDDRREAERLGCMLFDVPSVLCTDLAEAARRHAADFLDLPLVRDRLRSLATSRPRLSALVTQRLGLPALTALLQDLLRERVSIRDLPTLLHAALRAHPHQVLLAQVRQALGPQIVSEYVNHHQALNCVTLDPWWQARLIRPDPHLLQALRSALSSGVGAMQERGLQPILVCPSSIRCALARWAHHDHPNLVVLAWEEIPAHVQVEPCLALSFFP